MTKIALQAFIDTYGDRIFCINLDNTRSIYIGYRDGTALSDIALETIGDIDFIVVSRTIATHGISMSYKTYNEISCIQWIGVMNESSNEYRVDPLLLR